MKENWKIKKLNEVCEVRPSKRQVKNKLDEDDLVSYAPMSELGINQKYFSGSEERTMGNAYKGYTYFEEGDVVLAKITPCFENGKLGIARNLENGIGFGSTEFIPYRTGDELISEYLYYYLNQSSFRKEGERLMTGAVGHKRLPKDFYEEYEIPVPPLDEQKLIVSILDEAFEAIDQAKANIKRNVENAEDLFESKLNKVFEKLYSEFEISTIGDQFNTGAGGTPLKSQRDYYEGGRIPWLRSGEVKLGNIYESENYITQKGLDESSATLFPEDTVLVAMYGATAGDVGILRIEASTNQAVCGIYPSDNYLPEFLYHIIKFQREHLLKQKVGNAQPNLSQTKIKKVNLPVLPIEVQKKIVSDLSDLDSKLTQLRKSYKDKLENLEKIRSSILKEAFSGELTKKELVA